MRADTPRILLESLLDQWLSRSRRHTTQTFALMVATRTPQAADTLVDTVQSMLRREDTVLGLDQGRLAIVAADLRHVSDPLRIFRRIQMALPGQIGGAGVALSTSRIPTAAEMIEVAQRMADSAEACVYSDVALQATAEERLDLEASLGEAIRGGQILPYYQPIVELSSGHITSFEALARWNHPARGLLLPKAFLGVAADCGLLAELDISMLRQALEQLQRWQSQVSRVIRLSVNLCAEHFLRSDGLERLRPLLEAHRDVVPHLRVDISEQVLADPQGLANLRQLRNLKVGFHLDDFGVGPESFHCLASFPFHSLKIDRSLIVEMEEEVNAELIAALLRIARRMKMRTIAEGLVTHAQLEELRNLGCDEAQGFLFSQAVSAEQAITLLREEHCW